MSEKQKIIKTCYLSGPMDFVTSDVGKDWRKKVEKLLGDKSIDVFNPYRKPLCPEGTTQKPGVVLRQDIRIIDMSDILLVNASQGVESWGTASECMYAYWVKNIPVVAFVGERKVIPRWLDEQAEFICRDLETACKYIGNYNRRKVGGDEGEPARVKEYEEVKK